MDMPDLEAKMQEPGGTTPCPECKDGWQFHLYDDDGSLIGMTCCFCDWHRFAGEPEHPCLDKTISPDNRRSK
jgi:hypothetical protein